MSTHRRYGPYFAYPDFQCRLKFGDDLRFELLIVAYRDPNVTPERMLTRGMLNGIAIVFHADDHHSVVLDSHGSADRVRFHRPPDAQIAEFRRLRGLGWPAFRAFCLQSPLARQRWREPATWERLRRPDAPATSPLTLPLFQGACAGGRW